MIGIDPSSPYPIHFYKIIFPGATVYTNNYRLDCSSGTWSGSFSESVLVSSSIYSFFTYGDTRYLYLAIFPMGGSDVTTRYKSSSNWDYVYGSAVSGNNIIVSAQCSGSKLIVYNLATNAFTINAFNGQELFGCALEQSSSR